MAEAFAGFVCGYGLAVFVTPIGLIALLRARTTNETLARAVPYGASLIAVSIILHTFAFLLLTAMGILLGIMLNGIEESRPAGGLGSPNLVFTAFIIGSAAIGALPLALVLPRWRLTLATCGVIFAGTFGWLMPYLSLIGPDRS